MKSVTTQVIYGPRSVPPTRPDLKAVIIDTEKFVLNSYKAYTYAAADFIGDNDKIAIHTAMNCNLNSLSYLTIEAREKTGDTATNILLNTIPNPDVTNIGFVAEGTTLSMYRWALGTPALGGRIEVGMAGGVTFDGLPTKTYYIIAKVSGEWVSSELVHDDINGWEADPAKITPDTYDPGNAMIYEDVFGFLTGLPAVSVYLTIDDDAVGTDYHGKLTEITNYSQLVDMYGQDAIDTSGNIAYSAGLFYLRSGGVKTFYIAPMSSADGDTISDIIEELKARDDAYYIIYNVGTYAANKADADALFLHVKSMSSPLYKQERRLYVKESMHETTSAPLLEEAAVATNSALSLDNERVSLILDYGTTDSFIKYCARRYAVNRDYSLTNEPIVIGDIWPQVSLLTDAQKEELKDNGVVAFDQDTPMAVPKVMYQTTTYIEEDVLAKKEENIQIAVDELCRSVRAQLLPRIAKGVDNKVTTDPNSAASKAYISNLNADIAPVRRLYEPSFSKITVTSVEIDINDPRHVRLFLTVVPYYNVNRIDVTIYVI